jgi:UDP-3-O-[3-hydroxymyristoyl] glucosamine N-acyltransferase
MGRTLVHKGVKLDNFVQVAHNVEVGENTVISAQSGIAGSSKVGAWCMIGGQSGVSGHITVGDKVNFCAKTGAISNTESNQTIMGYPAISHRNYLRSSILFKQLPEMDATIRQLKKEIEELKAKLESR